VNEEGKRYERRKEVNEEGEIPGCGKKRKSTTKGNIILMYITSHKRERK